jgi:hypothetical protein
MLVLMTQVYKFYSLNLTNKFISAKQEASHLRQQVLIRVKMANLKYTSNVTCDQLAARENLIQMLSGVINYNSNCHSELSRHLPTTCLDYFIFPYLKNNVFKNRPDTMPKLMQVITDNCNLNDVPTLRRSFENMKHYIWKLKADISNIYSSS